ncbi:hypothetical protein [Burkholderia gladioli]|uniref:hypothetical protein n=1 Tax=Burkholderia gladioli TaxID=28095 RepID=UPI00163EDB4A|nr:hypothetical protein [Burkholderia gladioli]
MVVSPAGHAVALLVVSAVSVVSKQTPDQFTQMVNMVIIRFLYPKRKLPSRLSSDPPARREHASAAASGRSRDGARAHRRGAARIDATMPMRYASAAA